MQAVPIGLVEEGDIISIDINAIHALNVTGIRRSELAETPRELDSRERPSRLRPDIWPRYASSE